MSEYDVIEYEPKQLTLGALPTTGPVALIQQASDIAKELAKIIRDRRLASRIQGKEFVHVEGWSTMGAMLGVLPREVSTKRLEDGSYEATVELIRINDGAIIGRASAICGVDEKDRQGKPTWANRPEYARRSMSVTRATGKAYRLGFSWIMALAGYEPTPAEEMIDTTDESEKKSTRKSKAPNGNGDIHWIDSQTRNGKKVSAMFWAWATGDSEDSRGLTEEQVYTALGVEHIHDFTGTMVEAKAKIDAWIAEQQALEAQEADDD